MLVVVAVSFPQLGHAAAFTCLESAPHSSGYMIPVCSNVHHFSPKTVLD